MRTDMGDQDDVTDSNDASSNIPLKRVLPARDRRESAVKRQASSPTTSSRSISTPKKSKPLRSNSKRSTPKTGSAKYNKRNGLPEDTPAQRLSTPAIEEAIPTKVIESKPLPTSCQPQPSRLSAHEYQNIADSAVLAASLHRSRLKWLTEGIFDKYWIKPSKRKATEGVVNNPDPKTMQRLGSSAIIIGPHTFDATIYTVRDILVPRQPNEYPQRPVAPHSGFQSYLPIGPQPTIVHARAQVNQAAETPQAEVKREKSLSTTTINPSAHTPKIPGVPQPESSGPMATQPTAAQPGPDPVIRMLATRAATNPDLKALMKMVASSKASQEQLKIFQNHIDELNVIIRQQQDTERYPVESQNNQTEQSLPNPRLLLDGSSGDDACQPVHPLHGGKPRHLPPAHLPHAQHTGTAAQSQQHLPGKMGTFGPPPNATPYAHYPPPPHKMPAPEPRIKAIVLEFTTPASAAVPASQDRYLFPEYAVLDTPLSGQGLEMVCSFLVVRKGCDLLAMQSIESTSTKPPVGGLTPWMADEEYYQPVTMTIRTSQHRILEIIARSAKPLGEVQNKMKEIMQSKTRVRDEFLLMRLPREKVTSVAGSSGPERGFVDSAVEIEDEERSGDEDDELKAFYGL